MDIGAVNTGYSHTKWRYKLRQGLMASVRGPADADFYSDTVSEDTIALITLDSRGDPVEPSQVWFVGQEAVEQSVTLSRRENRGWIYSEEYRMLWHAAFSEMTTQFRPVKLRVVTGLPVNYFREQRDDLQEWLEQEHRVKRVGRSTQSFTIEEAYVMPELLGILYALTLTPEGREVDNIISQGRVGVLDWGGHNTGFLVADQMKPIRRRSRSIDVGCWTAIDMVSSALDDQYPGHGYRDHEIIDLMVSKTIKWRGRPHDIGGIVDTAIGAVTGQIFGVMSRIWDERLDLVVAGGGGVHVPLIVDLIREEYPQPDYPDYYVQVLGGELLEDLRPLAGGLDPVFGNVEGMYRYGLYRWG